MITSIKKIKDGLYILNDAVAVSNITFSKNQVKFNIDFDVDLITNEEATLLADSFIREALVQSSKAIE